MSDRTVLCVDDETHVLASLKRLLRKEDYTFLAAGSGSEALSLLKNQPVQLVLSDQRMPEMTGTEFLQKVKEHHPDTVRVVLSGYADAPTILDAINKGEIYRFLTKPWDDQEMKVAIRQCLGQYDLLEQNRALVEEIRVRNEELQRLNEDLEEIVTARTQSLRLSQEILAKLPLPVIGVSCEGFVVLSNESATVLFPASPPLGLGTDMRDVLPSEAIDAVQDALDGRETAGLIPLSLGDHQVRLRLEPLKEKGDVRGSILIFEEADDGR